MRDYKKIMAFQKADLLTIEIYKATKRFPREELYGLVSQIRRAAVSIPTNIAEGASRQHKKDFLNFLYISRASLAETEYLLDLSYKLCYISKDIFNKVSGYKQEASKTLFGLIKTVSAQC